MHCGEGKHVTQLFSQEKWKKWNSRICWNTQYKKPWAMNEVRIWVWNKRNKGENCLTLKSSQKLFYIGVDGILIKRRNAHNITLYHSVSISKKINKRYRCKIIQIFAPTEDHQEEETGIFHEYIKEVLNKNKKKIYNNFKAKIGIHQNPVEKGISPEYE